jgi:hypothetical protein
MTFYLLSTGKDEPITPLSELSTAKELEQCTRLDEHRSQVVASDFSDIKSIQFKPLGRFLVACVGPRRDNF